MDPRSELGLIRKQYKEYSRNVGESVIWYEFTPFASAASAGSFDEDVYNEGVGGSGGRKYSNGLVVPVLMIQETEDQKRAIPEGRQPIQVVNLVASVDDFRNAGISEPYEYRKHLNDLFQYDGRMCTVTSYKVRGRLKDDIVIVVEGLEVYTAQEFMYDTDVVFSSPSELPWPSTFPKL